MLMPTLRGICRLSLPHPAPGRPPRYRGCDTGFCSPAAQPSGNGVVPPAVSLRRLELNRFCRAIDHAGVASLAAVVPNGPALVETDIAAGADPAAEPPACAGVGDIKAFVIVLLNVEKGDHQFGIERFCQRRHGGDGPLPSGGGFPFAAKARLPFQNICHGWPHRWRP